VADVRNNLGHAWNNQGDYDKAIIYYEQALASDLKTLNEDHPNIARDRNNLGHAWYRKGEYDIAIAYYDQALDTLSYKYGENHPKTKIVVANLVDEKVKLAAKNNEV
jgi:tetratricopeptide (TPR) repeat protein